MTDDTKTDIAESLPSIADVMRDAAEHKTRGDLMDEIETLRRELEETNADCRRENEASMIEIGILRRELEEAQEALRVAERALCDWVCIYAPDECKDEDVAAARARITAGGTLIYIADALTSIRRALSEGKEGQNG